MEKRSAHNKIKIEVPEPTLRRLPVYLHFLQKIWEKAQENVSAPEMGKALDLDATQVVKDISYTGCVGKPRVGYNTYELIRAIEDYLSFNKKTEAVLVGAGNLGSALLHYNNLESFGIRIIAAFDVKETKVGKQIGKVSVIHVDKMPELVTKLGVEIGILTSPSEIAQEVAEMMVDSGIKAIWNFTPIHLQLSEGIIVQNTSMYANAAILLKKLNKSKNSNHTKS